MVTNSLVNLFNYTQSLLTKSMITKRYVFIAIDHLSLLHRKHVQLNLYDRPMSTGGINQVTIP